jgi:hypothetical protein
MLDYSARWASVGGNARGAPGGHVTGEDRNCRKNCDHSRKNEQIHYFEQHRQECLCHKTCDCGKASYKWI